MGAGGLASGPTERPQPASPCHKNYGCKPHANVVAAYKLRCGCKSEEPAWKEPAVPLPLPAAAGRALQSRVLGPLLCQESQREYVARSER